MIINTKKFNNRSRLLVDVCTCWYEGPLSVLFAYDAIAYYMWALSEAKPRQFNDLLTKGSVLGRQARNKECKHGARLRHVALLTAQRFRVIFYRMLFL